MTEYTRHFLPQEDDFGPLLGPSAGVAPLLSTSATPPPTDRAWAVAFKINVAVTLVSALWFGSAGLAALGEGQGSSRYGNQVLWSDGGGIGGGGMLAPAMFVVAVVGIGWAFAWGLLQIIIRCSKEILQVAYFSGAAIAGLAAVGMLATGHWLGCIVPAFLCAWSMRFFYKRQSRIVFSSANLKVAAIAIKSMPGTVRAALLMSGVQVAWLLLSAVAAGGSLASLRFVTAPDGTTYRASTCRDDITREAGGGGTYSVSCVCDGAPICHDRACVYEAGYGGFWLGCFWVASLAWGAAVLQSLVTATVTGSVASWWFSPGDKSSVRGALYRATHGSFGSLCKAAAAATVVRLVVMTVRRVSKLGRCGNFLLERLRRIADYVLTYAICFISIYGLSFSEAGQRVSELFRKRGITTIANDTVVDVGLASLVLGATVLYYVVVAFLVLTAVSDTLHGSTNLSGVFGAALGLVCGSYVLVAIVVATMLEVLRSGFKAVFVCFVQDPEALAANHDQRIYGDLSKAWREMQAECPSVVSEAGHIGIQQR